jgi:hypothetical protein
MTDHSRTPSTHLSCIGSGDFHSRNHAFLRTTKHGSARPIAVTPNLREPALSAAEVNLEYTSRRVHFRSSLSKDLLVR